MVANNHKCGVGVAYNAKVGGNITFLFCRDTLNLIYYVLCTDALVIFVKLIRTYPHCFPCV